MPLLRIRALMLIAILFGPGALSAQTDDGVSVDLPEQIPLFPLGDVTLLPNTTQPFHVFEPRYRDMMAAALAGDSIIGMVMLRRGYENDYTGNPAVYAIGCAGVIVASERLPDGRYNLALRGFTKFRILSEDQGRSFRVAQVEEIPEAEVDATQLAERRAQVERALRAAIPGAQLPPASLSDAEMIDGLALALPMSPERRQELLEADGPLERAAILLRELRGANAAQ